MTDNISRDELKAKMDRGEEFVLVDALSAEHYQSSHLPGAINLPYEFVDEAESLLPDKDAEIVVYCMNVDCEASTEEARELTQMGYRNVRHYAEGKRNWMRAGLPVEGRRAAEKAARELAAKGYTNVRDYEEGKRGPKAPAYRTKEITNSKGATRWTRRARTR